MATALPGAEVSAMPAQVTPTVLAAKTAVRGAKSAMSASNALRSATTPISSKRGRRHQQCTGESGDKSEFTRH